MSSVSRVRTVFTTLSPTCRTAASGVPIARGLNLRAQSSNVGHDDSHGDSSARTDFTIPKFAGSHSLSSGGLVSRTRVNRESSRSLSTTSPVTLASLPAFFRRDLVGRPIKQLRHSRRFTLHPSTPLTATVTLSPPSNHSTGTHSQRSLETGPTHYSSFHPI